MTKNTLLIGIIFLFSLITKAQNDFEKLWTQVEKFEVDGLPKSALEIVDNIYAKANKNHNSPQIIKSLFYKSKFSLILEEDAQLKVIQNFKEQIAENVAPTKNVLENVLANLYWQYFTQNRYKFYNRTKTENKVDVDDFRTWDLETLFEEIHQHFKASLQGKKLLQKVNIEEFSDILQLQQNTIIYTPTLFDFLANNTLQFYKSSETSITKPSYQFTINNPDYLSDAKIFSTLKITSKDSLSLALNALKIYQKILNLHKITGNKNAFANIDVERINFVHQNATFENKESILLETLKTSGKKFKNDEASGLYAFEIAQIYKNQAKNNEALAICNQIIKDFPKSLGAQKCFVLKSQIEQKTLSILTEEYIPIAKNSRILVTYKNVEKLFFTAHKISQKQQKEFNKIYTFDDKKEFINKLEKSKSWHHKLRNENDYLQYSTEIIVPEFESGMYLILASENDDLNENTIYGTTTIQVTNLTLVENTFDDAYNYQVLDRTTGKPIRNANIHLHNKDSNRGAFINEKIITDKKGFASYKSNDYYNHVAISIKTKNDFAIFKNAYLYNQSPNKNINNFEEEIIIKPFIFTDRSIYRPGQTLYFKAIVIKKQRDTSEAFKNEYVTVSLFDVNDQIVKTLDLKLNDFGSVAGEFVIPNNGLTGEFTIDVDESSEQKSKFYENANFEIDYNNSVTISVEEYKRPKFETEFKPITESFQINDSIKINGFGKAFSGANITDAKVVYRVRRKVQYPSWYYWRRPNPNSNSQEITNGEGITDANGEFEITFKAIPDESVDKESLPVFNYEITADVTDINGETRSATTIVKVGYHSLIASILIDDKIDKNQKETIVKIETKNLNDEFVAAKGIIKIYKLQAPKNPLRKRPWSAPDYQSISENEFRKLFPNDPYTDDESDEKNWKKGTLVFTEKFATETSKEIILKNTKNWISGKYIIVLESEDKFGQEVKNEKRITIFSSKEKNVADNQLFTINANKTFYNVGDKVEIQIGSASKNMTVAVHIEKNHKIVDTKLIKLNNCIETIKIPVNKDDVGGFAIKYHFVNYNYFESGSLIINVPKKQESIEIMTNIFRDKLQPGQDETWSFIIKDDKNDAVAAEVLASMYDASLDEFKDHNWYFNPIRPKPTYNSYQTSNANKSFGNTNFYIKNNKRNYYQIPTIVDNSYNWFGFSLNNNSWLARQYLRTTKSKINSIRTDFDGTVTGFVSDLNGEPLPGVNVSIKGTSFGTETDFDGNYSIKIKKGDVLIVAYLGFKSVEYLIDSQTNIDVKLEEDANALNEVVVVGYGTTTKQAFLFSEKMGREIVARVEVQEDSESVPFYKIRGANSISGENQPLYIVDGKTLTPDEVKNLNPQNIKETQVLKDAAATALYGSRGANGVILITTKAGQEKIDAALSQVEARKNFKETAFFYPQLKTDKEGKVSFSFTMPEALTRWKLQLLAHSTDLKSAIKTLQTVTQKELMVVPNAPRFLREKDTITFSAKITNLTNNQLSGFAKLILTDAISGKEIDSELQNTNATKNFIVVKDGNTSVSWSLAIPENIQAVHYKIVAKAGDFSDGEQNVLPVLTNRMLVTETLPMSVRSNETETFTLDNLKNNSSSTLQHHKLTLEITSNPVWYAIQALPYLMEYPYECAEQTFSKYYASTLASFVANSNPKIQEVFKAWKTSDALLSNLEKNQELKSLIIQETPWLRDAQYETEQKKRIALLFDLNTMKNEQEKADKKLQKLQMNSGGFPWFKGSRTANTFITQHIATGFGHLQKLGIEDFETSTKIMIENAVKFLDAALLENYKKLLEGARKIKEESTSKKEGEKKFEEYLAKNNLNYFTIQYLYMRSFYGDITLDVTTKSAVEYYQNQSKKYWNAYNLFAKGQIALSLFRADEKVVANKILKSLKENSITSDELGMYWKSNTAGYYYYQAPVETQALMIETFSEIENDAETIDNLKIWLLKNKQTNQWKTTKATTEAVYALLLNGNDWNSMTEMAVIKIGDQQINPSEMESLKVEAGTGYFKTSWNAEDINKAMATISINKKGNGIAWGGLYWQYFEDLDKITSAESPLKLNKKLFLKANADTGKKLKEINKNTILKVGDLMTVRIEIQSDRDMEFIHLKDMRASGVEPINVLSTYKWQDNLGYYESTKDAATNFFFDKLPKGVYVFEYDVRVTNSGNFSNGISTIQSMYAPEFSSHSEGLRINVKN